MSKVRVRFYATRRLVERSNAFALVLKFLSLFLGSGFLRESEVRSRVR